MRVSSAGFFLITVKLEVRMMMQLLIVDFRVSVKTAFPLTMYQLMKMSDGGKLDPKKY